MTAARRSSVQSNFVRRRIAVLLLAVAAVATAAVAWRLAARDGEHAPPPRRPPTEAAAQANRAQAAAAADAAPRRVSVPREVRGIHLHMSFAGQLERFVALRRHGLNAIELDVKDEKGRVAFEPAGVPLVRAIGAAPPYYRPWTVARRLHARGIYLIGRVVAFQDPILAEARPALAVIGRDGSPWKTRYGLAWVNPHDRRVWRYVVGIAEAAARAGFDEIQFDYVRFPSDGDVSAIRYPVGAREPQATTIARFLRYAARRLHRFGVLVSADVFGLSATLDVGIGQSPRLIARYVDALYPMVYPSHYTPGSYGLADPNAAPGETVARSLADFRRALRGRDVRLVPWLQDFSLGRAYGDEDVLAQVAAARAAGADGFMLWDPHGTYTRAALAPP